MDVVRLASGALEVDVLPDAGARIHRLQFEGEDVLRTPISLEMHRADPFFWGAYVMAPWANRIAAGRYEVAGRTVELEATFRDGTAIHGQVHTRPWRQVADGAFKVEAGGGGWPWAFVVRSELDVADARLDLRLKLTNRADGPMPAGLGLHPWFRRPLEASLRAERVFERLDESPREPAPVSGAHDLRARGRLPLNLDAAWTDLSSPPVELSWPATGLSAVMTTSPEASVLVAASPAELDAVAIEPQTHAPNGLRRLLNGEPGALALLEPGASLELGISLAFERLRQP